MDPTRAEVMREQREREGWQERKQQARERRESLHDVTFFFALNHFLDEKKLCILKYSVAGSDMKGHTADN